MGEDIKYQLMLRKDKLCCLYVSWERHLTGVPFVDGLPQWGPSQDEMMEYRVRYTLGSGVEIGEEGGYEYDVDFEAEADALLVEHLESLRISENYRELQHQSLVDS